MLASAAPPYRGGMAKASVSSLAPIGRPITPTEQRNDVLLAVAICVGALISAALTSVVGIYGDDAAAMPIAVGYAFAVSAPLAVRRRWPCSVAVVVSIVFFIGMSLHVSETYAGNIAIFIAFYTVGAWADDRRRAAIVRVAITVGMFLWLLVVTFQEATAPTDDGLSRAGAFSPFVAFMLLQLLINALFFGGAYYFGERAWAAARQRIALEERSADLERERERTAEQAVALDRVRIARELHDVVAHHVSLMGVQAGAARAVMAKDPDAARETLTAVEASARSALGELRQLLETLRTPLATDATAPTTLGLDALPALVAEASAAGLSTSITVIGNPVPLPETTRVNLYRIAQEALTNARRHAGPGATADVRLRWSDDAVELEITNTGRLVPPQPPGLGMLGMRERAGASGGTIELEPQREGGFLVRVSVPSTVDARA